MNYTIQTTEKENFQVQYQLFENIWVYNHKISETETRVKYAEFLCKEEPTEELIGEMELFYDNKTASINRYELASVKANKIKEINAYDTSDNVNIFYYNNEPYWIDKATRVGLKNSTNDEIAYGRDETTLILGKTIVTLPCTELLRMLVELEVYAKDCYNVTAQHKINVSNLETIDEVNSYDITVNYPNKLYFND